MTTTVEKVTVSLPADLLALIEARRKANGVTRSEEVTDLLWRGWRLREAEEREERYRAAYQAQPDTAEELAWADMASAELFAPDDRMNIGKPLGVIQDTPSGEIPSDVEAVESERRAPR